MAISLAGRVRIPVDVLVQELDGESVLLNVNSGRYFGLDEVGTRMWHAVTTQPTLQAAFDSLLSEYEVDGEQLRHDLVALLEQLVSHGLVEIPETETV